MQIDLFNQALLLVVCFLTFFALFYNFRRTQLVTPNPHHTRFNAVLLFIAAVLLGLIARWAVQLAFPQDTIPLESVLWVVPLGVSLLLLAYNYRPLRRLGYGIAGVMCSAFLAFLLANNYYHYFPTIDSLFAASQPVVKIFGSHSHKQSNRHIAFEEYYQPLQDQSKLSRLTSFNVPASGHFSPRKGYIYLPPALNGNDTIRLPVIVLLPGWPGKPADWINNGLKGIMDDFAKQHKGLAPIVAVVDFNGVNDTDTECVNSPLGDVETYLAKDVPAYLKAHYQVSQLASDWTLAGYSAGGTCSTLVSLRNPTVYQNYMNLSGDTHPSLSTPEETLSVLFGNSAAAVAAHTPNLLLQRGNSQYKTMNAWYFVGYQDNPAMVAGIEKQVKLAADAGLTVEQSGAPGQHTFLVWKQGYQEGLDWLMRQLRLTQ